MVAKLQCPQWQNWMQCCSDFNRNCLDQYQLIVYRIPKKTSQCFFYVYALAINNKKYSKLLLYNQSWQNNSTATLYHNQWHDSPAVTMFPWPCGRVAVPTRISGEPVYSDVDQQSGESCSRSPPSYCWYRFLWQPWVLGSIATIQRVEKNGLNKTAEISSNISLFIPFSWHGFQLN